MIAETKPLSGCQHCAYRIKSQEEAHEILHSMVKAAHLATIEGGGTLITAAINYDVTLKLCLWEAHCEDCENHEDLGDSLESESQWENTE